VASIFLADKGQRAVGVATVLAGFLASARRTLEIAIYDLRLEKLAAEMLIQGVRQAMGRGVTVRCVFNEEHGKPIPVPPPGRVDRTLIERLGIAYRPVNGIPDLMHHKYVVKDAGLPGAQVLTGSTNWTTDSWTREENVIVRVPSPALADWYLKDFEELWETRSVQASGSFDVPWIEAPADTGSVRLRAFFCPGRGEALSAQIGRRIMDARRRVYVCSPVITSAAVLNALFEVSKRPLELGGVYDATQMAEVISQWRQLPASEWKIVAFEAIRRGIPFGAKASIPYEPGSVHNFMHAKTLVADDTVFVGSFNLSHSGEKNAENVLEIESAALADQYVEFIQSVAHRYSPSPEPVHA
jgi:phosphatidylserine/phosphatidylglycerophosphate/cardiolipin synthase-like enzyme